MDSIEELHDGNLRQDTDQDLGTVESLGPSVFSAKYKSDDTPSYEEAMHVPLDGEFRKALEVERDMLNIKMKAWKGNIGRMSYLIHGI
jgi:hypothetical protein